MGGHLLEDPWGAIPDHHERIAADVSRNPHLVVEVDTLKPARPQPARHQPLLVGREGRGAGRAPAANGRSCARLVGAANGWGLPAHHPCPNGGNGTSKAGSLSLAELNLNSIRCSPAGRKEELTMKAPSGGNVMTFWRLPPETSITCRSPGRSFGGSQERPAGPSLSMPQGSGILMSFDSFRFVFRARDPRLRMESTASYMQLPPPLHGRNAICPW